MARKTFRPPEEGDPGLDMSSMIDISFLLLIYFIATSSLQPKEADLGMTLPTSDSSSSSAIEIDTMNIKLDGVGIVYVNDEPLDQDANSRSLPLLKDRLKQYKTVADLSGNKEPVVILEANDGSNGQRFVDVLNVLADVGLKNVTLSGFSQES
ncbi:MAG: biopolymer transporter ExbD [Verrucomicrobiota bacterium]